MVKVKAFLLIIVTLKVILINKVKSCENRDYYTLEYFKEENKWPFIVEKQLMMQLKKD